jgi:glucose/mannose transport system permease protein
MAHHALRRVKPLTYVWIALALILSLVPIYMTVITALKARAEINLTTAWRPPSRAHFQSFADALDLLLPSLTNSLVLTITATVLSAFLGSINGFVFSKNRFRGSEIIFTLFLFGMFIPDSIVESARLDGAGFFSLYFRMFIPLSGSGFVVVGIWQFTQIWNEFLWGVTLTRQSSQPVTVGLAQLAGGQAVSWNLPMAGSILASIPVLIVYIALGRYFIRGLLASSVKE